MLLSLAFGLLGYRAWTPLAGVAAGLLVEVLFRTPARDSWRAEAGLGAHGYEGLPFAIMLAIALNYAVYGIGRGVRYLWLRRRPAQG